MAAPHPPEQQTKSRAEVVKYEPLSSKELVQCICLGDGEALLHLIVDRCGGIIKATSAGFDFQGDLLHEVMVHLFGEGDWNRLKSWNGEGSLESWVGAVARRICLTEYRNRLKQRERFERLSDDGRDIPDRCDWSTRCELGRHETRSILLRAIAKLNERDQTIIHLHCLDDPPTPAEEMERILSISREAFRTAKMRALNRLREFLREEGHDHV